ARGGGGRRRTRETLWRAGAGVEVQTARVLAPTIEANAEVDGTRVAVGTVERSAPRAAVVHALHVGQARVAVASRLASGAHGTGVRRGDSQRERQNDAYSQRLHPLVPPSFLQIEVAGRVSERRERCTHVHEEYPRPPLAHLDLLLRRAYSRALPCPAPGIAGGEDNLQDTSARAPKNSPVLWLLITARYATVHPSSH